MSVLDVFFSWPTGGIWSNILASIIWGLIVQIPLFLIGYLRLHRQAKKHHEENQAILHRIHNKL